MGSIDVGIGHDDDLVIAQFRQIEIVADAGPQCGDQGADFDRRQHLIEPRPLDIQDLTLERQNRLILAVAALLRRPASTVALDQEQFGFFRVALLTIGQFAGQ